MGIFRYAVKLRSGAGAARQELSYQASPPQEFFSAYERIFLDLLEGNTTLFVRGDEAEESWRVVEPILEAWEQELVPLLEYPAGSDGPSLKAPGEAVARAQVPDQGIG